MFDRNQLFEDLRQQGFRLYDQRDQVTIQQRRLTDLTADFHRVMAHIQQSTEEASELCRGSHWAEAVRQEERTWQGLKASCRQSLADHDKALASEAQTVQALIDKNVQAKARLFD